MLTTLQPIKGSSETPSDEHLTFAESRTPGYTEHIELPEQGGKKYVCCEGCGRELLTEFGGRSSLPHADDYPNALD